MLPTADQIRLAQSNKADSKEKEVEARLITLKERLNSLNLNKSNLNSSSSANVVEDISIQNSSTNEWDWAQSYSSWSKWNLKESLEEEVILAESRLETLNSKKDAFSHIHDHTEERKFFELPEKEKFQQCDAHRSLGNALFAEGSYARAADHYQTAMGYYEYCFPEDEAMQKSLDEVRIAASGNLSLCYIRLGLYRKAIEIASQVIRDTDGNHAKAFYRRGQAYRMLDEYENAIFDLKKALALAPTDSAILDEMKVVQSLSVGYKKNITKFASTALVGQESASENEQDQEPVNETIIGHKRDSSYPNYTIFDLNRPLEPFFPVDIQNAIASFKLNT